MARLLQDRDSTDLHLNLARRHQRLARRRRQPAFAAAIQPAIAALVAKKAVGEEKDLDRQEANDVVFAADGDQDDAVRNLFDAGKIHDRAHPEAAVLPTLFPDGGFTDLIDEPVTQEPSSVEALAVKVEALGADHPLHPHGATLRAAAGAVREALADQETAVRAAKAAEAEEELAQAALRRQYEGNYFDARKSPGRPLAERLFPRNQPAVKPAPTAPAA